MKTNIEGLHYQSGKPVTIEMVDGFIERIIEKDRLDAPGPVDLYIAPGLIDSQVNGCNGIGFSLDDLSVEGIRTVTRFLWTCGVTTYLPTVITGPRERLEKNLTVLAASLADPDIGPSVPGFHLEGPYISSVKGYRGAHNVDWIRPPDRDEFRQLNDAAGWRIRYITVAPEIEGALDFIEHCAQQEIVVGIGHHNATAALITEAVRRGAAVSTHLGNGCATLIHRHDNPIWPQLAEDRLMASLIADGFHLRPEELRVFLKAKGPDRLLLVSDMTELAGMPPGEYPWNGETIVLTPEGQITYPGQNVLAGASLPLNFSIRTMMNTTGCSLSDAIHLASTVPAKLHGLSDRGELEVGKRGDCILFSCGESALKIHKTTIAGREVYSADMTG